MPCNSIITTTLDLSKANADVIASALADLGFHIDSNESSRVVARKGIDTVIWEKGKGTVIRGSRYNTIADDLSPAYAKAAIKKAARKNGWKWKQDKASASRFVVSKR